ncbi:hypothetical protein [Deinococcus ficus]|uniref:hypothetical protein n=1 Tax=Deinococcus ficus TaxID=317577 RepID=UPI00174902D7|nr:hypothetical protein [Deinococcus ficus]GHF79860.1 hypothetical protein GCM10017782_17220 [Deinococcus ficus]
MTAGARLDRDAANALAAEIRESVTGMHLLPEKAFWARLGMPDPTSAERAWLAGQFEARGFAFTLDEGREAVYIVWRGGPSPAARAESRRRAQQEEEADWRQLPDHERHWAELGVPNSHPTGRLRTISIPQPKAELVIRGELRTLTRRSPMPFPSGGVLVHASRTWTGPQRAEIDMHGLQREDLSFGAVIGMVQVIGEKGQDPQYLWDLASPRRFTRPVPLAGRSGVFLVDAAPFAQELWEDQE